MPETAALRAAVFEISTKNLRGCPNTLATRRGLHIWPFWHDLDVTFTITCCKKSSHNPMDTAIECFIFEQAKSLSYFYQACPISPSHMSQFFCARPVSPTLQLFICNEMLVTLWLQSQNNKSFGELLVLFNDIIRNYVICLCVMWVCTLCWGKIVLCSLM